MEIKALSLMAMESLRVAPAILGLLVGIRFVFYDEEGWNLDRIYRRLRDRRKCRRRRMAQWPRYSTSPGRLHGRRRPRRGPSAGAVVSVSPWFTRWAGLVLLGGATAYATLVYGSVWEGLLQVLE